MERFVQYGLTVEVKIRKGDTVTVWRQPYVKRRFYTSQEDAQQARDMIVASGLYEDVRITPIYVNVYYDHTAGAESEGLG